MIPPFNELGHLPPGVHPATLDEIEVRLGNVSEVRRVQMESLRWMVELARKAGIERIVLNGSFVTDIIEPNDVDCALLTGANYPSDIQAALALEDGLPFLDIAVVIEIAFKEYTRVTFASDRLNRDKGMIEVVQWN